MVVVVVVVRDGGRAPSRLAFLRASCTYTSKLLSKLLAREDVSRIRRASLGEHGASASHVAGVSRYLPRAKQQGGPRFARRRPTYARVSSPFAFAVTVPSRRPLIDLTEMTRWGVWGGVGVRYIYAKFVLFHIT